MLPLEENELTSEDDWHSLKDLLVLCQHYQFERAAESIRRLHLPLAQHRIAIAVTDILAGRNAESLDELAVQLTQRQLPDAWTLLERL